MNNKWIRGIATATVALLLLFYVGYHFWGFLGLLLAPMLASAAVQLSEDFPGKTG